MGFSMKPTKLYEIANEIEDHVHIMVPEGYAGFTQQELEAMEQTVKEADKKRKIRADQILHKHNEEKARLNELLEQADPPWKRQRDKYNKDKPKDRGARKGKPTPTDKKGCKTCAAKGLKRLIQGGAKLLKSELGIDAADKEMIQKRKEICVKCPIYDFGVCREIDAEGKELCGCGCFCAAKVKLKHEECPKGKW